MKRYLKLAFGMAAGAGLSMPFSLAAPAAPPVLCAGCSVVLLAADAWSAVPSPSGPELKALAPGLQAFYVSSVHFDQAISASSWTFPSFFSLLSSASPSRHGMVNHFEVYTAKKKVERTLGRTNPSLRLVSDIFRDRGYATGAFTGGGAVRARYGFSRGFDRFVETKGFGGLAESGARALAWIGGLPKRKPFFAFVHGYDLHGQGPAASAQAPGPAAYVRARELTLEGKPPGGPGREAWEVWHRAKLREFDGAFTRFLAGLEQASHGRKVVVVLVSDHGSELLEHGGIGHGHSLYDELIRVPLAFRVPGVAACAVPAQVSTLDVVPTLAAVTGAAPKGPAARQIEGTSLEPWLRGCKDPGAGSGAPSGHDVFSETEYRDSVYKVSLRATDGWKYIEDLLDGHEELFFLPNDPAEKKNLAEVPAREAKLLELRERVLDYRGRAGRKAK